MSPAVKTPGTLVIQRSSRQTFPRSVIFTPSLASIPLVSGPRKPIASRTRSAFSSNSVPGTGLKSIRPLAMTISTLDPCSVLTRFCASPVNLCVAME